MKNYLLLCSMLLISTLNIHAIDSDEDGMSDVWQRRYGIINNSSSSDPDGDGRSNRDEAIAGTNPNDPTDFFSLKLIDTDAGPGEGQLEWRSEEGKLYRIEMSVNGNTWSPLAFKFGGEGLFSYFEAEFPIAQSAIYRNDNFIARGSASHGGYISMGSNENSSLEEREVARPAEAAGGRTVWWTWKAPSSEDVTITTEGSDFDTTLAVYSGDDVQNLVLMGENDDGEGLGNQSAVTFASEEGNWYQIQVDGFGNSTGNIILNHPASNGDYVAPPSAGEKISNFLIKVVSVDFGLDPDSDQLFTWEERILGTDPFDADKDTDNDQLSDSEEFIFHLDPLVPADAVLDFDSDGLTNVDEIRNGLDPRLFEDASLDSDGDGLNNTEEIRIYGTDVNDFDTDDDLLPDLWEVSVNFNPTEATAESSDVDQDGLSDYDEWKNGTDPRKKDSDGDGVEDAHEVNNGSNPTDPSDAGIPAEFVKVPITVYGDYARWELTITSRNNGRKFRLYMGAVDEEITETLNLNPLHTYDVNMLWREDRKDTKEIWYCWQAQLNSLPVGQTYPDYSSSRIAGVGEWFVLSDRWIVDNREGLLTAHTHMTNDDGGNIAGSSKATLIPMEFITPAGDPEKSPKDAGEGQNEFTFSTATDGMLEINFKVKLAGASSMPAEIQNNFTFEVEAIGKSLLQWDVQNPNGKATVSGDFLTARVVFTNLPEKNEHFGKKMVFLKYGAERMAQDDFEVFFSKDATNHPGAGAGTTPNWFYYWKDGDVCGIPKNTIYDDSDKDNYGFVLPGTDRILRLGPLAAKKNTGPEKYTSSIIIPGSSPSVTFGDLTVTGTGEGIFCVAETVEHELYHLSVYDNLQGKSDDDQDGVATSSEGTLTSVNSSSRHADTFSMGGSYSNYGDDEIRCRAKELNISFEVLPKKDWANPGSQSLITF